MIKKLINSLIVIILLFAFSEVKAQNHCVQFSKKNKRTVLIKEGRNISFVFAGSEEWSKGKITKITTDSVFLEQYISKDDLLTERESNFSTTPYTLSSFRMMAYNNTPKAVGKSTVVVLLVAAAILSGGAGLTTDLSNDRKNSKADKKFFKKNVNFNRGWRAEIVECNN